MFNIPSTIRKSIQVLSIFFILVAMLPLSGGQADTPTPTPPIEIPSTQGAAAQPESQPTSTALQQFTVGGYVLGVQDDGFLITGVDHMLKTTFVGARAVHPSMESSQAQTDEQQKAPPLGKLSYVELWEGVSLTVENDAQGALKIGYQIAPGAKVEQVRLRFNRTPELSADGGLLFRFEKNELRLAAPQAWQQVQSEKQAVTAAYKLIDGGEVTLEIGEHDPNQTMAVEGDLLWNTFLGGASTDRGKNITLDANGNVYITGESELSWGTPLRAYSGLVDAFVAKLDSSGTLLWNTFLGGLDYDSGSGIAMDSSGNAYISGSSSATWGAPLRPISPGSDVFVVKLDSSGTLLWNTFLGGLDYDSGSGIAVDGSGNAYVCGNSYASWGTPLRPFSGGSDALVAKLDSSGTLLWNTFLGGIDYDSGSGIALDSSGNAFITGISSATWGTPLRPISPGSDVFVVKLDSSGTLLWNTFLGGNSVSGIAMDSSGNAYITGSSSAAWGAPLRPFSGGYDAFVAKLDSSGTLLWNTFLGGFDYDRSSGIAVDGSGNAYISGSSSATWGTPLRPISTGYDAFVAKLDSSGTLLWNTFLGGDKSDSDSGIAVDGSGNAYISGSSSATWGAPLRPFSGASNAFVAKLDSSGTLLWNTFLGGLDYDYGNGIVVDGSGNAFVTGSSSATWGTPLRPISSWLDAFVAKLGSSGTLLWNTFLGGNSSDDGSGIAVDSSGNAYVCGYSSNTWGIPVRPFSGIDDAFVAKLSSNAPPTYTTSGKVTDKDGKVVPNVTFTTNTGQSATTNASGDYRLTDLAAGTYTITPSSSVIGVTFNPSSLTITVPPSATGKNFLLLPLSNCSNIIKNGEFETDTDWYLPITRFPAGMKSPVGYDVELAEAAAANYSTDEVHGGTRSLRTGIVDAVMNTYSYSSGWQQVTISTSIVSANLRFWYFPRSLGGIDGHDVQLMLFLNNGKQEITRPLNTRSDEQIWKYLDVDMKSYAGQTLWVYFGTLNDGYNSVMAMYVDDVTLDVCK